MEVSIISWSHGWTVDKTQCVFGQRLTVFLIPNIKRGSRWSHTLFSVQAQCLTVLVMNYLFNANEMLGVDKVDISKQGSKFFCERESIEGEFLIDAQLYD